jgi:MFS family permease
VLTARAPLELVRQAPFRRLYLTRLSAQVCDGVFQVALASYVLFNPEKATTAGAAAKMFAILLLPYSLVGPFTGVLLDRWRRQRVLLTVNLLRAVMALGVALVVAAGVDNLLFYVSALAVLSVNRFFLAGLSAALPHVVHRRELILANAVSTTSGTLAAGIGGAVGYLIDSVTGASAWVLACAAMGYLVAAWFASRVGPDELGPDFEAEPVETREALGHVLAGLRDGARHVWSHKRAGYALIAIASHRFFYGLSTIATVLLYRNYFHGDADTDAALGGLALIFLASGLGVLTAAAITPSASRRLGEERWIVWLFTAASVVELACGFPFQQWTFAIAAYVLGIVAQSSKICVDTIVQRSVDQAYRGRVFSFYDVLFNVAFVAAGALGALLLPTSGKSYAVITTIAVGYAATALAFALVSRRAPSRAEQSADQR